MVLVNYVVFKESRVDRIFRIAEIYVNYIRNEIVNFHVENSVVLKNNSVYISSKNVIFLSFHLV